MDLTGKKIAIVVANYFEEAELTQPKKALQDAGASTTIISPTDGDLQAMQGDVNKSITMARDLPLSEAQPDDFDAVVVPGGTVNADTLRQDESAQAFVKSMLDTGKPVAVICHGPWLLVSADVVKGRNLTSFPSLQVDIENAGGSWADEEVIVDGNLITSRTPKDLDAFNDALLKQLV